MRDYQIKTCQTIVNKGNWAGSNMVINTENNVTKVWFYGNLIGVVNHCEKVVKVDNCGFKNACTTARINPIKMAAKELGYKVV